MRLEDTACAELAGLRRDRYSNPYPFRVEVNHANHTFTMLTDNTSPAGTTRYIAVPHKHGPKPSTPRKPFACVHEANFAFSRSHNDLEKSGLIGSTFAASFNGEPPIELSFERSVDDSALATVDFPEAVEALKTFLHVYFTEQQNP